MLDHGPVDRLRVQFVSPGNKWLAITVSPAGDPVWGSFLRVWDTQTWRIANGAGRIACGSDGVNWLSENLFAYHGSIREGQPASIFDLNRGNIVFSLKPTQYEPQNPHQFKLIDDRILDVNGYIYDILTFKRLKSPNGRKFHPDLAKFAPDGRFLPVDQSFTFCEHAAIGFFDTKTEKMLYTAKGVKGWTTSAFGIYPMWDKLDDRGPGPEILDLTSRRDIPPDLLELWAQVAVRGELGPGDEFVPWDEPTWQRKQQELATRPVPYPDFPFPGYLASDHMYWLQAHYYESMGAPVLATELLRRAEASGDKAEVIRWRAVLASDVWQIAPPPRQKP